MGDIDDIFLEEVLYEINQYIKQLNKQIYQNEQKKEETKKTNETNMISKPTETVKKPNEENMKSKPTEKNKKVETKKEELQKYKESKFIIVIELYENQNGKTYELIRNFLFQFIILKNYREFFYLMRDIKIFIEVSSDYTNTFYNDFKILKLFKNHHIQFKNNLKFYEENRINMKNLADVLSVLNSLKLLKDGSINEQTMSFDLFIKSLTFCDDLLEKDYDSIIKEYFVNDYSTEKKLPNFGQIRIFADYLGYLLSSLYNSPKMMIEELGQYKKQIPILKNIRGLIIYSYVQFVKKFSSLTYDSILENQEIAAENQKKIGYEELSKQEKEYLIKKLNTKKIISYNEIEPSLVLFNNIPKNSGNKDYSLINPCTILTIYDDTDKRYKTLNEFYKNYFKLNTLTKLYELSEAEIFFELCNICLTPANYHVNIREHLQKYEFTTDNYAKMVLIYLRIKANIPLILMGETGCGKTSLIETLVLFLQGQYRLIKFNIHSGVSYIEIMKFLRQQKLVLHSEDLFEGKKDESVNEEKIVLFIDEINTTNSINLLCDLFKKRKFLGLHLKESVYVIGACNPYRLMLSNNEEIGYRNKKLQKVRNLVYSVNPLPLSLINYVFDFGNLKDENEKKYIKKFVHSFLNNRFSKDNNENYAKILDIICDAVHTSQKFIRENSEISAVSLREIQRFSLFFEFFYKITREKKEFKTADFSFLKDDSIFVEGLSDEAKVENIIFLKSANLSLFMCYYLRIINPEKREKLAFEISQLLKFDFLDYPLQLEKELADNINLEKGIAKNRALLDNLFSLFVCLNNKVPVFICGKAGCSKSLSFSLLNEAMKGEHSKKELFRKYPSIYLTSYQGSLTSSSNEIETVFKIAKKKIKNDNKNLSVILFDEMGLAEISPNNPLKVIHSELDGNQQVGFVGISNWTLDASKMNRGIHLSVQEPGLDDLILTSNTIATDIYDDIRIINTYKTLIENLTKSYYEYKEYLKIYYKSNYDFHGARDFYFLIKIAAYLLKINDKSRTLENIAMESIERNFGGLELDKEGDKIWMSTTKFKQIFSKIQNNYIENIEKYDIFSCIKNNLENKNNRYLLLITSKTKNDTLIEHILKKLQKTYRFMQGSKLKEDQNENYVLQKAWSIISSMENGEIIILKDMEIVYPKFYDLFNKNFQRFGSDHFARIVLDSTKNERHIVHKNFRCIILLDQSEVEEQDTPFLNRFEKHIMSFRYLLTEKQNHIADELYQEIIDLTTIPNEKEKIKYKPMLVNINEEEIRALILDLSMKIDDIEKKIEQIYKVLIPTFTQENILNSLFSPQKKYIKKEDLIKIYEENTHTNIYKFLETIENNKLMIYTFSPNNIDVFSEKKNVTINNKKFGILTKNNTVEIIFNNKLSENMLTYFFQLYYEKNNFNLFIIHFKVRDTKYLKYIKFRLDDFLKENKEKEKKIFLFIIHIEKNYNKDNFSKSIEYLEKYHSYFFSFLSEYKQITIDSLLEQRDISVINLFNKTNEELLVTEELFDINEIIKKEFSRQMSQMATNQSMDGIISKLDILKENGILETIINKIQNTIKNSDNVLRKILRDYSSLFQKDNDFISYLIEQVELLISSNVGKLIGELGRSGYLVSYLFEKEIPLKLKQPIFSFINNINLIRDISYGNNIEDYSLDMKIPGSRLLINKLSNLVINCKIDYLNKEDNIRKGSKKKRKTNDDLKTLEDVHYEKKQYLKSRLYNEELLTEEIFSEYSNDILRDVFTFYFYDKNTKKTINENQKAFLFFIYSKKNEGDNLLDHFLYFFLWIGSYHDTIVKILEIFNKFDKYFKVDKLDLNLDNKLGHSKQSLLNSLKDVYDLFIYEDKEKSKINEIFYRISESFCHVIININNVDFKIIDLNSFCSDLNEVAQILTQFNSSLNLGIKGHFSLPSIIKIIEYSKKKNKNDDELKTVLISFIKNMFEEKMYLLKKDTSQAKKSLDEQLNIIINLSDELSVKILVNKLMQYYKLENYKLELIKIMFKYPQLLKYSSLFFNYILLTLSIEPTMQKEEIITQRKKETNIKKFGEIKMQKDNKILVEINKELQNNEILREIIIYIFELRIIFYFDKCFKECPQILLTGLNFDYYRKAYTDITNNEYGELTNIGLIFNYVFIRIYLYYFFKYHENGDLTPIHHDFYTISNSDLGKMILLYISKVFILNNKKEYFLIDYRKDETVDNWKETIISQNRDLEFHPIIKIDNFKTLLFLIWSKINNDNLNEDFIGNLEIIDIYYIINFAHNEIRKKKSDNKLETSKLLIKLNEKKDKLNFDINTNDKIKKVFRKINDSDFLNDEFIKSNLDLFFNTVRLYVIGFIGNKDNHLFSLAYSDQLNYLIKLFYYNELKEKKQLLESYYRIKKYLEEEFLKKKNYFPPYICSCGRCYFIKDSLPMEEKSCECGLKIGGQKEVLVERENHFAIYYNESQKNFVESGRAGKIGKCKLKGILLQDFKEKFIIPILNNCQKLNQLLLNNNKINDENFSKVFIKFVFLQQIFLEYKTDLITEKEINAEFERIDLLIKEITGINTKIEEFLTTKNIKYHDFMNYFCESYAELLQNEDCLKNKKRYYDFFNNLLTREYTDQKFNNIEINILTSMTFEPRFKNESLKYLLTAAQYPDINKLKNAITLYKKKPLSILKAFINLDKNRENIDKLLHIETINNFINAFSEENSNLISRQNEEDNIELYLNEIRRRSILDENGQSPLDIQFEAFCKSYQYVTNVMPLEINRNQPVKNILNDNKIKGKETVINKVYCHLIDIQNEFLNEIINNYSKNKDISKDQIIIKNAIEQIQKEIPVQLATKADIFSFNVHDDIIQSFEELFYFYSLKNIFNENDNKIDYSKYSEVKFKLNMIEKDLINIILTGKKLFSKEQITYKFYSDPYEIEEKTKNFEKFTELYEREDLSDKEKNDLSTSVENLKKIILPNLEILIFYLIKENKYQGNQKIKEVKLPPNLYLNKNVISLLNDSNDFKINQLISIYEYIEEQIWSFIADRYVNQEYKRDTFWNGHRDKLVEFYNNENKRELKNNMLASLLIKFICRYLPYGAKGFENGAKVNETQDLFEMIKIKNMNLSDNIKKELEDLTKNFGAKINDAIDITTNIVRRNKLNYNNGGNKINNDNNDNNDKKKGDDDNRINPEVQEDNVKEKEEEEEDDDDDNGRAAFN